MKKLRDSALLDSYMARAPPSIGSSSNAGAGGGGSSSFLGAYRNIYPRSEPSAAAVAAVAAIAPNAASRWTRSSTANSSMVNVTRYGGRSMLGASSIGK